MNGSTQLGPVLFKSQLYNNSSIKYGWIKIQSKDRGCQTRLKKIIIQPYAVSKRYILNSKTQIG